MTLTEILVVKLGTRLGKILLKSYLRDPAEAIGDDLLDVAKGKIEGLLDRREAKRQFEKIGERIAAQLEPLFEHEFRRGKTSVEAVIFHLSDALDGKISAEFFLGRDLDITRLQGELKRLHPFPNGQFSSEEEELYNRALGEVVRYIVEIAAKLPRFEVTQAKVSLRRLSRIEDLVGDTTRDLKQIKEWVSLQEKNSDSQRYEIDYRLAVSRNLNYLELFGADLSPESRRQALSVAYVSLTLAPSNAKEALSQTAPVETILASLNEKKGRLLIRGEAGSGKSTLFRWAAIQAAQGAREGGTPPLLPPPALDSYNSDHFLPDPGDEARSWFSDPPPWRLRIPFLLRLRDCKGGSLPSPDDFPALVAKEIGAPPAAWVRSTLSDGRGLLLFDGLDEIPNLHRETARREIAAIVETYPANLFLVSTRPEAVPADWLGSLGFREARVNPMSDLDRARFIDKWHEAVADEIGKLGKPAADLPRLAAELKQQLPENPPVARLATNPLLCAMICALHRDRNQKLPETQSELCEYLCEVLLHRRERESGFDLSEFPEAYRILTYSQKRVIVQEIAHFMVLNEESSITTSQAEQKVGEALKSLAGQSVEDAEIVCRSLVERSGMFREPQPGRLDFVHNTFKEYLAGERFTNSGDTGLLVREALDPTWRRVVLFAVATPRQGFAADIIRRLVARSNQDSTRRRAWQLLALQCRAAALLVDDELEKTLDEISRVVFPPKDMGDAEVLASAGDTAVAFLSYRECLDDVEAAACVRTLRLIGTSRARRMLEGYLEDCRESVISELCQAVNPVSIKAVQGRLLAGVNLSDGIRSQIVDLSPLSSLTDLQVLHLSETRVSDVSALSGLSNLRQLYLSGTEVSDVAALSGMTGLQILFLSGTRVSDLSALSNLTGLEWLDLGGTEVSDVTALSNLGRLKWLDLRNTRVSDVSPLSGLNALLDLYLFGAQVSNVSALLQLRDLKIHN